MHDDSWRAFSLHCPWTQGLLDILLSHTYLLINLQITHCDSAMMKETLQARSTQVSLDGGTAEDEQCIVLASPLEQTITMGCKDTFKIKTKGAE